MDCSSEATYEEERPRKFSPLPVVRTSERDRKDCSGVDLRLNRLPSNPEKAQPARGRFPSWLHRTMPSTSSTLAFTGKEVAQNRLHTVCEEAKCPNLLECYSKKTATFLLLGRSCTRACGFCDIDHMRAPPPPDKEEPMRVAESCRALGLKHVVLTMVSRDDLEDGGAFHVVQTMRAIRRLLPDVTCELLVSDFSGNQKSLQIVVEEGPEIFNHNVETVARLTPKVRHIATYERSLNVLVSAKSYTLSQSSMLTKSGIMVGLGETEEEVYETLRDLKRADVDIVTIGQYLQASQKKLPVKEFITPEQFERYKEFGLSIGIPHVYSGPFVRSSYNAALFVRHKKSGTLHSVESD